MFRLIRILSFWILLPLLFMPLGSCSLSDAISAQDTHFSYSVQGAPTEFDLENWNDITIKVVNFEDSPFNHDYLGWFLLITLLISFFGVNLPPIAAWMKPLAWLSIPILFLAHTLYTVILMEAQSITLYGHLFVYIGYTYGLSTFNAYLPKSIRLH